MTAFQGLRIYQLALEGVAKVYSLTLSLGLNRDFSLVDQIRRAAGQVSHLKKFQGFLPAQAGEVSRLKPGGWACRIKFQFVVRWKN